MLNIHAHTIGECVLRITVLLVTAVTILASCGGSDSSDMAGGGVGGTGKITGVITGFGSVFVNDTEFETGAAVITIDDERAEESSLRVGMKVIMDAKDFRALSIRFEPEVEGPVTSLSPLAVLGQKILIDSGTEYDGLSGPADLEIGFNVEVSGFIDAEGNVLATFIGREDPVLTEFELTGIVSGHNSEAKTFKINSLTVDYGEVEDPPVISDGVLVEVEGRFQEGIFVAEEVEPQFPAGSPGEEVEMEGIITQVTSSSDFKVNTWRVQTTAGTEFHRGTSSHIVENARVEVKGKVNDSGIIVAKEIEFR